jgi:hypothetical protein
MKLIIEYNDSNFDDDFQSIVYLDGSSLLQSNIQCFEAGNIDPCSTNIASCETSNNQFITTVDGRFVFFNDDQSKFKG